MQIFADRDRRSPLYDYINGKSYLYGIRELPIGKAYEAMKSGSPGRKCRNEGAPDHP
ncbi:MAG: hypothetical protein ACNS62_14370 [Candidatus Cyclobacteriaceae bacterium M3_2C_046]